MRALLIGLLLLSSCTQSAPPPSPSLTPLGSLRVLVAAEPSSSLAARARLLGAAGTSVEVVARPEGNAALAEVVRQAGDTRTLALVGPGLLAAEVLVDARPKLGETVPVARLPSDPFVLAVAPTSPLLDAATLRRQVERDSTNMRFAGLAPGSPTHQLAALVVRDVTRGTGGLVYAAYPALEDAIVATAGGQSQVLIAPYSALRPALAAGRLRPLALSSAERVPGVAVPTLRESGFAVVLLDWALLVAPPGLSTADLTRLRDLARDAHAQPAWTEAVRVNGSIDDFTTEGMTTFVGTELTRTQAILRDLKLVRE